MMTSVGVSVFVAGEILFASSRSFLHVGFLAVGVMLVAADLVCGPRRDQGIAATETPGVGRTKPLEEGKRVLAEILAVTNKIQSEDQLLSSLSRFLDSEALNLIHFSTIFRRLSQLKLLGRWVAAEQSRIVAHVESLFRDIPDHIKLYKAGISVIITAGKYFNTSLLNTFVLTGIRRIDQASVVQLLLVLPPGWSCYSQLENRLESVSQADLVSLSSVERNLNYEKLIVKCDSFSSDSIAFLFNRQRSLMARNHIRSHISPQLPCSKPDLISVLSLFGSEISENFYPLLTDYFFDIPSDMLVVEMVKRLVCFNENADRDILAKYLEREEIDWNRIFLGIKLFPYFDLLLARLRSKLDNHSQVWRVLCAVAERFEEATSLIPDLASRDTETEIFRKLVEGTNKGLPREYVPKDALGALLVLASGLPVRDVRSKESSQIIQESGAVAGFCFLASFCPPKCFTENVLSQVEDSLSCCSTETLVRLVSRMPHSHVLASELADRLRRGALGGLEAILQIVETYSQTDCETSLIDPVFVALQEWLVPEIPKLDLASIARITSVLENFSSKASTSNDESISTPVCASPPLN
jgi:hypothetical protein